MFKNQAQKTIILDEKKQLERGAFSTPLTDVAKLATTPAPKRIKCLGAGWLERKNNQWWIKKLLIFPKDGTWRYDYFLLKPNVKYIFVKMKNEINEIRVAERSTTSHLILSEGAKKEDILYAGDLMVDAQGKLIGWTNASVTFQPSSQDRTVMSKWFPEKFFFDTKISGFISEYPSEKIKVPSPCVDGTSNRSTSTDTTGEVFQNPARLQFLKFIPIRKRISSTDSLISDDSTASDDSTISLSSLSLKDSEPIFNSPSSSP